MKKLSSSAILFAGTASGLWAAADADGYLMEEVTGGWYDHNLHSKAKGEGCR